MYGSDVGRKIKTTGVEGNINYYPLDTYRLQCDNNGRCVVGRKIKTTGAQGNKYPRHTYLLQCDNNRRCVVVEVGRKIKTTEVQGNINYNIQLIVTSYNVTITEDVW